MRMKLVSGLWLIAQNKKRIILTARQNPLELTRPHICSFQGRILWLPGREGVDAFRGRNTRDPLKLKSVSMKKIQLMPREIIIIISY